MTPGEPYHRRWFQGHISRNHYSLGEANDRYNDWLIDPQYGPAPPLRYNPYNHTPTPSPPPVQHHTPTPPHPTDQPTPVNESDDPNHNPEPNQYARAQTIVQDVHTSPDDANAVLDSGAMMNRTPQTPHDQP